MKLKCSVCKKPFNCVSYPVETLNSPRCFNCLIDEAFVGLKSGVPVPHNVYYRLDGSLLETRYLEDYVFIINQRFRIDKKLIEDILNKRIIAEKL